MTKTKTRLPYRFTLTLPAAFTANQLMQRGLHPQYITVRKRIEKALADGEIVEAAKFRPNDHTSGRLQRIYVRTNVENVQLTVEKAFAGKGELVTL